ncbi:type IV pilin [Halosimplex halophilum]|uniref:type IV pilin n=1 Tax=Halosimplex halophilum TaxID=2559572 RepID=UPI00107F6727|nr:type IV pilin N-terminal domain-containing protein [Halosimplex halophilum]
MQLKQLLNDDDAVSPVIGVILMVAITVILAAVIASFVLGLGNQAQQGAPTSTIGMDYEQVWENSDSPNLGVLEVTHDGGDSVSAQEIYIRGSGINATKDSYDDAGSGDSNILDVKEIGNVGAVQQRSAGTWNGTTGGDESTIVSGDETNVPVDSDYEISVVWQAQEGDSSSTLNEQEGPDA